MNTTTERACAECGEPIIGRSDAAKYCRDECKKAAKKRLAAVRRHAAKSQPANAEPPERPEGECPVCGAKFVPRRNPGRFAQRYCSPKCRNKAGERRRLGLPEADSLKLRSCPECQKPVDYQDNPARKYCGDECVKSARSRRQAERNRLKHRAEVPDRRCTECGKSINHMSPSSLSCSKQCSWKRRRRRSAGIPDPTEFPKTPKEVEAEARYWEQYSRWACLPATERRRTAQPDKPESLNR